MAIYHILVLYDSLTIIVIPAFLQLYWQEAYGCCSAMSSALGWSLYYIRPKIHMFCHILLPSCTFFVSIFKFLEDSGHTRSLGFRCHMCWRIQLPLLYFHQHAQDPESQTITKLHKVDFAVCVYCVVGTQRS